MKTHLKTLLLIAISLMATVRLNAQEPFFFTKNGLKITLAEKDGKGKINGYTQSTVVSVEGEPSNWHRRLQNDGDGQQEKTVAERRDGHEDLHQRRCRDVRPDFAGRQADGRHDSEWR